MAALDLGNLTFNGKLLFDQFSEAIEYASDISYADTNSFDTIEQDFLFNSGILVFDVAPGGGWDQFKLSQVDEDGNENDFFQQHGIVLADRADRILIVFSLNGALTRKQLFVLFP